MPDTLTAQSPGHPNDRLLDESSAALVALSSAAVVILFIYVTASMTASSTAMRVFGATSHILGAILIGLTVRETKVGTVWSVWAGLQWLLFAPVCLGASPNAIDQALQLGVAAVIFSISASISSKDQTRWLVLSAVILFVISALAWPFVVLAFSALASLSLSPNRPFWGERLVMSLRVACPAVLVVGYLAWENSSVGPLEWSMPSSGIIATLLDATTAQSLADGAVVFTGVLTLTWAVHLWLQRTPTHIRSVLILVLGAYAGTVLIAGIASTYRDNWHVYWTMAIPALLFALPWVVSTVWPRKRTSLASRVGAAVHTAGIILVLNIFCQLP